MKFEYKNFSCDLDVFYKKNDILVRFYDGLKEQSEEDIVNCVIVDSGYGYLFLKYKGDAALIGGFLDDEVFVSDDMIEAAIEFLKGLSANIN